MPEYAIHPSLRDKVVVISGGAEGIGAACVEAFASQGSMVHFLDVAVTSATELIEQIQTSDPPVAHVPVFHECDVTDLTALQCTAEEIIEANYGKVNVLLNNAAGAGGSAHIGTFEVTEENFSASVNVNLRHQFFLTQHLFPALRASGSGSVINMGSINWRIPGTGLPIYTTCKAAVLGLTRTHAREFGPSGVRVNSVMPGSIATERQRKEILTPEYEAETLEAQALKRVLLPGEVARTVLFLASADASGITGSSYCVDGGWVGDP